MRRVARAWNTFWFEPASTAPLALLRIAFGVLVLLWALSFTLDAESFLASDGIIRRQPERDGAWGLLGEIRWAPAPRLALGALAIGGLALAAGYRTRIAAVVVFVALLSITQRNPYVGNAGDSLIRLLALFLVFAPAGAALSVDRWRRHRAHFWESPRRAPWVQRLIQVQLSILYVSTVWAKVQNEAWNDGTATSWAFRLDELQRFPLPDAGDWLVVTNGVTWGVLAVELALGILVWNRKLRPWVLLLGVGLHLGIEYGVRVGFFSWAILTAYIAWLPGDTADRLVERARRRLEAAGYAPARAEEEAGRAAG